MGARDDVAYVTLKHTSPRILSVINEDCDIFQDADETCETPKSKKQTNLNVTKTSSHRRRKSGATTPSDADLKQLKETATKLKLNTRRPSFVIWRAQYLESPKFQTTVQHKLNGSDVCEKLTKERQVRISNSLEWIRGQLAEMRKMDQTLARQFLGIRKELTRLKLQKSCEAHEDMLDDATLGMEEFRELSKVLDEPHGSYAPSPLKHVGVTKMNLCSRRFSTC